MSGPILPGAAVGVLGSGQLGRMFAIAARRMGYRVHTLSPDDDTPTGQVADVEIKANYDDLDAVRAFASNVAVVTFEFENVPAATAEAAETRALVRPSGQVLHVTQHRLREKNFLRDAGFPVTPFETVRSLAELHVGMVKLGAPCILKTAGWGYDGKGQVRINTPAEAEAAWQWLCAGEHGAQGTGAQLTGTGAPGASSNANQMEAVLEAFVDFDQEVSVVAARGLDGQFAHYGVISNQHRQHILDLSLAPALVTKHVAQAAEEIARGVLQKLDVVGVLCVEFFLTHGGELLINELAPRPHNSGHLTFDACVTSQFEQQLRAICGLPLGSTELLKPAAMANLLGEVWQAGEPDWAAACATPEVKLHLYGKATARPGRKMGHLTALAATSQQAAEQVLAARAALVRA